MDTHSHLLVNYKHTTKKCHLKNYKDSCILKIMSSEYKVIKVL